LSFVSEQAMCGVKVRLLSSQILVNWSADECDHFFLYFFIFFIFFIIVIRVNLIYIYEYT